MFGLRIEIPLKVSGIQILPLGLNILGLMRYFVPLTLTMRLENARLRNVGKPN